MDEPMDIEKRISTPASFYLVMLPGDIWDLIARYLRFYDIESKKECIERTKTAIKKNIPLKYYYKDFQIPPRLFPEEPNAIYSCIRGAGSILTAFCPNEMNVALLNANNLKIVNIKKDKLIHEQNLVTKDYQHIALSRNATMFATVDIRKEIRKNMCYFNIKFLTIQNIASKKSETIKLPNGFALDHSVPLAFNKQGTYIILHGIDYAITNDCAFGDRTNITKAPVACYMMFPVTVNEQDIVPGKKTLQHYFQQRCICKEIASSETD